MEALKKRVAEEYERPTQMVTSLLQLLDVFVARLFTENRDLNDEERISFIRDAFQYRALKQGMEYVGSTVTLSTIHAAKGLEWDYVFLPDMEKMQFPNYWSMCKDCRFSRDCNLLINASNQKEFLEELSVFYVGVTRARKQVIFSASQRRITYNGSIESTNVSCLVRLPGIQI